MDFEDKNYRSGIFISKTRLVLLVVFFLGLTVVVGLIVGLTKYAPVSPVANPSSNRDVRKQSIPETPWEHLRIPSHTKPLHYDLTLYPDFYDKETGNTFTGNVTVHIAVAMPTNWLLIHALGLRVLQSSVTDSKTGKMYSTKKPKYHLRNEFFAFETEKIPAGSVVLLKIHYSGLMQGLTGLYRSTYDKNK